MKTLTLSIQPTLESLIHRAQQPAAKSSERPELIAQWSKVDGQLVCEWIKI